MDEVMQRLWTGHDRILPAALIESWGVPLDIIDGEKEIIVKASLPDVEPEKIDVTIDEGTLSIRAASSSESEENKDACVLKERRTGSFFRSVRLPDMVDGSKARSTYAKGVLTVTLPKVAARRAQKIKVEVSSQL
jgi:HSP20 family protein